MGGLALLLGATRRLVLAITAFTLGHSATLALAALGLVHALQAAVEVAIAGTIVSLALSLARRARENASDTPADAPRAAADSLIPNPSRGPTPLGGIARRPGLLPFAFGLLHGLGFAGALSELGLPQHAIPLALFAFNLGIELGQLAAVALFFAAAALVLRGAAKRSDLPRLRGLAREAAATAIGALGVFWCLDRAAEWLFP